MTRNKEGSDFGRIFPARRIVAMENITINSSINVVMDQATVFLHGFNPITLITIAFWDSFSQTMCLTAAPTHIISAKKKPT